MINPSKHTGELTRRTFLGLGGGALAAGTCTAATAMTPSAKN
ncbi:MAG: hypothetical protein ACN4GF_10095 [Lentimonas sp.]